MFCVIKVFLLSFTYFSIILSLSSLPSYYSLLSSLLQTLSLPPSLQQAFLSSYVSCLYVIFISTHPIIRPFPSFSSISSYFSVIYSFLSFLYLLSCFHPFLSSYTLPSIPPAVTLSLSLFLSLYPHVDFSPFLHLPIPSLPTATNSL